MKKILLINGPNMNRMDKRVPAFDKEGTTLQDVISSTRAYALSCGFEIEDFQDNHQECLINHLVSSGHTYDGVIINPGPLAQYGNALAETLSQLGKPVVEVHLINIFGTGENSLTASNVDCVIVGLGKNSYLLAVDALKHILKDK